MMASPSSSVFGDKALWGVSDCGQLMGNRGQPGLTSIEPEGTYEHLAIGVLEEGYTIAYKMPDGSDHVKYDVFEDVSGIVCLNNHICRNDKDEFVKTTESMTDDGLISIRQTFIISKNGTRVVIRMEFTNCGKEKSASIVGSATLCFSRWIQRRGRQLH